MDSLNPTLNAWAPRMLSVLRIMAALVLLQYPFMKLLSFPAAVNFAPFGSLPWIAAVIEIVTGLLILVGFFTRPAAFLLAGTMAAAYFIGHAARGLSGSERRKSAHHVLLYVPLPGLRRPGSLERRRPAFQQSLTLIRHGR